MDDSVVKEIKDRIDIVDLIGEYMTLKKIGASYQGLCPFHSEKNPSFNVSPQRQSFKCFGCGAYGDIFTFVMKIDGIEFKEALKLLAQKAGVKLQHYDSALDTARERLSQLCEDATRFFEKQLQGSKAGKEVQDYLLDRKINKESIKKWRLGYAPEKWRTLTTFLLKLGFSEEEIIKAGLAIRNEEKHSVYDRFRGRIIFPIGNLSGQVIGFGGRIRPGKEESQGAKYINTPTTILYDKSRVLYGLDKAKTKIRELDRTILVEGYTDVVMSHQAGFANTVSVSGTALTSSQLDILKRYSDKVIVAFDMDEAGRLATQRSISLLQEKGFLIRIITADQNLDPADIIKKSPKDWEKAIKESQVIFDFYFQRAFTQHAKETPEGRREIERILLPLLSKIPNKIEQAHWVQKLAQDLNVDEVSIMNEMSKVDESDDRKKETTAGLAEEVNRSPDQLSRMKKLEKRILALIAAKKLPTTSITAEQIALFSPLPKKIIQQWKKNKLQKTREKSRELDNFLGALALEIDKEGTDVEEELIICLVEVERLKLKEELEKLSQEIRKAEKENKEKLLEKLIKEFQKMSQKLIYHGQIQDKK